MAGENEFDIRITIAVSMQGGRVHKLADGLEIDSPKMDGMIDDIVHAVDLLQVTQYSLLDRHLLIGKVFLSFEAGMLLQQWQKLPHNMMIGSIEGGEGVGMSPAPIHKLFADVVFNPSRQHVRLDQLAVAESVQLDRVVDRKSGHLLLAEQWPPAICFA